MMGDAIIEESLSSDVITYLFILADLWFWKPSA